jgi:hypothetical protein
MTIENEAPRIWFVYFLFSAPTNGTTYLLAVTFELNFIELLIAASTRGHPHREKTINEMFGS